MKIAKTGRTFWACAALILGVGLNGSTAGADFYVIPAGKKAKKTVLVSPQDTATASGTALMDALAGITDASATNPYLLIIEPGIYDMQGNSLQMKPYVDMQGSGQDVTKITGSMDSQTSGVLRGVDHAELRFLTVENAGGGTRAIAVYNNEASPMMTNVTATASGATNHVAVSNGTSSSPTMTNVIAETSGGAYGIGVSNVGSSSPTMTNVTVRASGATTENYGVYNNSSSSPAMTNVAATASGGVNNYGVYNMISSSPAMTNVAATASGGVNNYGVYNMTSSSSAMTNVAATASGGANNYGVYNNDSSSPAMMNVAATASGGTSNYGVYNLGSSPLLTYVTATGSGGTNDYGVYNIVQITTPSDVRIDHSVVTGAFCTVYTDVQSSAYVGNTRLEGGAVNGGTCAGVYDENYTFYTNTCP